MAFKTCESIDTNIILRLILRDVPAQCLRVQGLFMRQGYVYNVADLAIEEVVYVLQKSYGWTRDGIIAALRDVLEMAQFNYNRALFERVFPMYLECPKLSFNDCCLASYAALNQAEPLWTFDQALAKESGTAKLLK